MSALIAPSKAVAVAEEPAAAASLPAAGCCQRAWLRVSLRPSLLNGTLIPVRLQLGRDLAPGKAE